MQLLQTWIISIRINKEQTTMNRMRRNENILQELYSAHSLNNTADRPKAKIRFHLFVLAFYTKKTLTNTNALQLQTCFIWNEYCSYFTYFVHFLMNFKVKIGWPFYVRCMCVCVNECGVRTYLYTLRSMQCNALYVNVVELMNE